MKDIYTTHLPNTRDRIKGAVGALTLEFPDFCGFHLQFQHSSDISFLTLILFVLSYTAVFLEASPIFLILFANSSLGRSNDLLSEWMDALNQLVLHSSQS